MRVVHIEVFSENGECISKSTIMNTYEGICEAMRLLSNSGTINKLTIEFYNPKEANSS